MKTCTLCVVLTLSFLVCNTTTAQVRVCVFCASNINEQPDWGPIGYEFVYYYYIPEMEVYYYVPGHQFIYQKKGIWVVSASLPARYSIFDLYKVYKVVLNNDNPDPILQHETNRTQYDAFKKRHDQPVIRDSNDSRYQKRKGVSSIPIAISQI